MAASDLKVCLLGRFIQEIVHYFKNIIIAVKEHELTIIAGRLDSNTLKEDSPTKKFEGEGDSSSEESYSYAEIPTTNQEPKINSIKPPVRATANQKETRTSPPLKFHITVKKIEAVLPRNTASIEATALLIDEAVLKNKTISVSYDPRLCQH